MEAAESAATFGRHEDQPIRFPASGDFGTR
jgi:hypothetical protein